MSIRKKLKKYKKLYNILSWIRLYIVFLYYRFFMILFSIIPIKNNKIMIVNYSGKGYGDNAKYIVNELKKNEQLIIYWAIKSNFKDSLPSNVNYVKFDSIKYLFHLATSKIWINNSRFYFGIRKRKNQFYIQTWHSTLRLKKIEKDAIDSLTKQVVLTCKCDSKMIDLIISGSRFSTNIYKNSFWYDGEVKECGTPRCDLFFNESLKQNLKKDICKKYNVSPRKKIVLYAPTFRKNTNEKSVYIDSNDLSKKLGNDYVLFVRMHPISKYRINVSNTVFDLTNYPDMQELISISDFLITDYSGCCFDMMVNNKPCILVTKDLKEYLSNERNLYFDFDELPFPNVKNINDLVETIKNFNINKYNDEIEKFKEKVGVCEAGNASKELYNLIINITSETNK